ncbi:hypothetical protein B0H13DRAFT_1853296 [Mycena leptocephala]|nr:hypothetical protein B0H13DRAFT_1853296 [Mycena leptocephala]
MDSLAEHDVEKEGRVLDDHEKPAPDVLSVGMAALTHGSSITPLAEFNQQFEIMRERRGLTPISDVLPLINLSGDAVSTSVMTATVTSTNTFPESDVADSDVPPLVAPDESDDELEENDPEPVEEDEVLFAESPTLTRFDEGDVELDMDDVPEWYLDEEDDSESDLDDDKA